MLCPNCGRELSERSMICPDCGTMLRESVRGVQSRRRSARQADTTGAAQPAGATPEREAAGASRATPVAQRTVRQGETSRPAEASSRETPQGMPYARRASAPGAGAMPRMAEKSAVPPGSVVRVRHAPKREAERIHAKPAIEKMNLNRRRMHWAPVIISVFSVLIVLGIGCTVLLVKTEVGQRQLARWGYDVSATAYIGLGDEYLDSGYVTRAIDAYKKAYEKEPDNVEAALDLGSAYEIDGQRELAIEIYNKLMEENEQHVEAYNRMIRILRDEGHNAEAVELMRKALEKTGSLTFETMINEFTPAQPVFTAISEDKSSGAVNVTGRYRAETVVTIASSEGATVYFTLSEEEDPLESGVPLEEGDALVFNENDTRLYHIDENGERTEKRKFETEGKVTIRAVAISADGVPSTEATGAYNVIIPTPDAPSANIAPGPYKKSQKVSLRGAADTVEIHYTMDGTTPTLESPLYTEPIQLPIGRTTLRAIALSSTGKVSYEMSADYKVEGNLKKMFSSSDTFSKLELMKTAYSAFEKKYGAPSNYTAIEGDGTGASYEGTWSWGVARFVEKTQGKSPVLYYLETTSANMTGPRSTKVGMSGEDVAAKFRDLGAYPNEDGERLLYNYSDSKVKVNTQLGTYRKTEDGNYALHYYYPSGTDAFVELSYYLGADGNVARIVWTRYRSEVEVE